MSSTIKLPKPSKGDDDAYSYESLFWQRREHHELQESKRANDNPDCIIHTSQDTVVDRSKEWNFQQLVGSDKRLKELAEKIKIKCALPIQRVCWPQIYGSPFPFICVAPRSSGKTFTHLFYIATRCIADVPISKTNDILKEADEQSKSIGVIETTVIDMSKISPDEIELGGDTPSSTTTTSDQQQADVGWGPTSSMSFADINPDDHIKHPKYIVICSSQSHVETIGRELDRMKKAAFGDILLAKRRKLPPKFEIIHVHQPEEKLAIKFIACEVLITTPGALLKCVELDLVDFTRCRRVFFDDIDLSLQLHNHAIRDIFKLYIVQMHQQLETQNGYDSQQQQQQQQQKPLSTCTFHMFSRKWTDLMKQSMNTVFRQYVVIFGSFAEASVFSNTRFEIEYVKTKDEAIKKLRALVERYESTRKKSDVMAISCTTESEAKFILAQLDNSDKNKAVVMPYDTISSLNMPGRIYRGPVYITPDNSLEFVMNELNNVTHLVHFSLPKEPVVYDQRFRYMSKHLVSTSTTDVLVTVFFKPKTSSRFIKELYDVLSRSSTTLRGTKLELRDHLREVFNQICPRWATTGVCRLEKLSKDDKFGSFCPNRHSFLPIDLYPVDESWPSRGQVKLTICHLINPCEFYFWFEAHRDKDTPMKRWKKFESSGTEFMQTMQVELNNLQSTRRKVPLEQFNRDQVYGVYFQQELRVDRIMILEDLDFSHLKPEKIFDCEKVTRNQMQQAAKRGDAEYSERQVQVVKVDYGVKVHVYLKNIFALPESLASIEPQCHRGFCLGVKPTDNEPDWLYKAKKNFHKLVCVENLRNVTAWLRAQNGSCFWFEGMIVSRELPEIETKSSYKTYPHEELIKLGLAVECKTEPPHLPRSERRETLCKWATDDAARCARWAFLRKDKDLNDLYLLHVLGRTKLDLAVRDASFNKQLINLEDKLLQEYQNNQLENLSYFAEGVFCLVRWAIGQDPTTKKPIYSVNRCRIKKIIAPTVTEYNPDSVDNEQSASDADKYIAECLDHGDETTVGKEDLFVAKVEHLKVLPFQMIRCTLADLDEQIYEDGDLLHQIKVILYDVTRTEQNDLKIVKCRLKEKRDELYMYVAAEEGSSLYIPLITIFEQQCIPICSSGDPELRKYMEVDPSEGDDEHEDDVIPTGANFAGMLLQMLIKGILDDIITKELGIEPGTAETEEGEEEANQLLGESLSDLSLGS